MIFQYQIADLVERHSIPPSLVMNFDQTPLKYAPVANQTLSRKGSKHVAIKGLSFKNQSQLPLESRLIRNSKFKEAFQE